MDDALRARVNDFMKFQIEGAYKKAFTLVADDSGDYFLQANKPKYLSYTLDSIEYSDDFTKATVKGKAKQTLTFAQNKFDVEFPLADTWKVENGEWVWYRKPTEEGVVDTPFGPIKVMANAGEAPIAPLPKDASPEAVAAAAKAIRVETSVSKKELRFEAGKSGQDELVFHNGAPGTIRLVITLNDPTQTLSVNPKDIDVQFNADTTIRISYNPDNEAKAVANGSAKYPRVVRLTVEPFGQEYLIPVTVYASKN